MPDDEHDDATQLMIAAAEGDQAAAERLLPLVYQQLRGAAQLQMAQERADHTLQPTALVHEAFMKLVGDRQIPWQNRRHFYVAAAEAMRQILIDHARSRGRLKRGGELTRRHLDFGSVAELVSLGDSDEIVALDAALRRLEAERPRVAQVVQFRFFAGLSIDATAESLGVSARTVDLDWAFARAWLFRELSDQSSDEPLDDQADS